MRPRIPSITALVSLFLLFAGSAASQSDTWRNITSTTYIHDIAEDGPFLWLATGGGLVRYTKSSGELQVYTRAEGALIDNRLSSVALDSNGRLWIIVDGESVRNRDLVSFDGTVWKSFATGVIAPHHIDVAPDGKLWCGLNRGTISQIYSIVNDRKSDSTQFSSPGYVELHAMTVDGTGRVWGIFNYPDTAVGYRTVSGWRYIRASDLGLGNDHLRALAPDGDSAVLIAGSNCLVRHDGVNMTPILPDTSVPLDLTAPILFIQRDSRGRLWVVTRRQLAMRDGNTWTIHALDSLLEYDRVEAFLVDSEGTAWVGTYYGLHAFDGTVMRRVETNIHGLTRPIISSITFDKTGTAWIGTDAGLYRYDGTTWSHYTTDNSGLVSNLITGIVALPDNTLWITTWDGLSKFDGTTWQSIFLGDSAIASTRVVLPPAVDRQGNVWTSIYDYNNIDAPIIRYDGTSVTRFDASNTPLPADVFFWFGCFVAVDSSNNIWFASVRSAGLARFNGTEWSYITQDNSGTPLPAAQSLTVDRLGRLLLTSSQGLYTYDAINGWSRRFADSSELGGRYANTLAVDRNNSLWFGLEDAGARLHDGTDWTIFDRSNSKLPSDRIRVIAFDSSRRVWFGTPVGIGILNNGVASVSLPSFSFTFPIGATLAVSPNPASGRATVSYRVSNSSNDPVSLDIIDAMGRTVLTCIDEKQEPGLHTVVIETERLSPGWYAVRLQTNGTTSVVPMIVSGE